MLRSNLVGAATSARGAVAGIMLIMAGGRFGLWNALKLADTLPNDVYAWSLALLGGALLATLRVRNHTLGRLVAALAACLLAGMAWDVGRIGNTALMEGWMAVCLAVSALSAPEC